MTPDIIVISHLADLGARFIRVARGEKRPLGAGWQHNSTGDPVDVAMWLGSGLNVGLLLGPESGLVDVEYDDDAGRDQLSDFGILDLPTPTWRSARGEHRLFRWEPWMPQTAVLKTGWLELRLGGRAAQSVLPPSRHPDGVAYEWIVRPGEVDVASFPAQLMEQEMFR
jgi:hypothetical protein